MCIRVQKEFYVNCLLITKLAWSPFITSDFWVRLK